MTEAEWQDRYRVTSRRGRIWTRDEVRQCSAAMLRSLRPDYALIARRTAVQLVLDDEAFMRPLTGMVPARVVEDVAFEAMRRIHSAGGQP